MLIGIPAKCQNGHKAIWRIEIGGLNARVRGVERDKKCDCPKINLGEGYEACGDPFVIEPAGTSSWIKVEDRLPEEGSLVIGSSGEAWGFAVFEEGKFQFETWCMPSPVGKIIEWMIPVPSRCYRRRNTKVKQS